MNHQQRITHGHGPLPVWGLLALGLYSIHAGWHLAEGHPEQLLWACHLGSMSVVIGLLAGSRWLNAMGTMILLVGLPLWLINLFTGGRFILSSPLMHVGVPVAGLVGLRRLGLPHRVWLPTLLLMAAMLCASRQLTAPAQNINLAFVDWRPLQILQIPPQWHLVSVLVRWAILLKVTESALRWLWNNAAKGHAAIDRLARVGKLARTACRSS